MKNAKIISTIAMVLTVIILCAMCATVASAYTAMWYQGKCFMTSFPAWVAFFYAIPFIIGIAVTLTVYFIFAKKARSEAHEEKDNN